MNDTALIIRDDSRHTVLFSDAAESLKTKALESAALIARVTNAAENANANEALKAIREIESSAEKARLACTKPWRDATDYANGMAKTFIWDLREERNRIEMHIANFQALERARAKAEEAKRILELTRIENEKQAELKQLAAAEKARIDESARIEREREEAIAKAKTLDEVTALREAAAETMRKNQEAQKDVAIKAEAIEQRAADQGNALPMFEPVRVKGQSVRDDWEITISDVHMLYRFHPNCVELKPRLSEIRELLNAGVTPRGVNANRVVKAGVRLGKQKVLDV